MTDYVLKEGLTELALAMVDFKTPFLDRVWLCERVASELSDYLREGGEDEEADWLASRNWNELWTVSNTTTFGRPSKTVQQGWKDGGLLYFSLLLDPPLLLEWKWETKSTSRR